MSRRRWGSALALPVLGLPLAATPAWSAAAPPAAVPAVATPPAPPTRTLPGALDVFVPYQGQTVCDPRPRPGTLAFAQLMVGHYGMGGTSLIGRTCTSSVSEHYEGRAWDWMLDVRDADEYAVARSVLSWLTKADAQGRPGAMARRFGIMYIIYNGKMWRAYAPERGWADYSGSNPHTDHIHFSFTYDGAAKRTSWWTGVATTSYLTSLPPAAGSGSTTVTVTTGLTTLRYGMRSEAVRRLQVALGGLPTTGYFGDLTKARVAAYQKFVGLAQTGVADVRTQEILFHRGWRSVSAAYPTLAYGTTSSAVATLQAKLGSLPTTGWYGPMTKARVAEYQKFVGLPQTGVADPVTQSRLWVRGWTTSTSTAGATSTSYPTLSYGMTSDAVKRLQTRLGSLPTTGWYGPMTRDRVSAYQRFVGLPQTGVADHLTQQILYTRGWSTVSYPTLSYGMTSEAVKRLQTRLGSLPTTGWYGPMTRDRVSAYQRFVGLPQTGVADSRTQQILYSRGWAAITTAALAGGATSAEQAAERPEVVPALAPLRSGPSVLPAAGVAAVRAEATTPVRAPAPLGVATVATTTSYSAFSSTVLAQGARGAAVRALQRGLGVVADGVYGPVTRAQVLALQFTHRLPPTGIVTPREWDVLERREHPFADRRRSVVRPGDTGPQVSAIQRALGVAETGVFDAATSDAVRAAQRRAGLAGTGLVAARTWELLDTLSA